ncbi:hypothetical protein FNO01nite_05070 [Flavobacterium noncentrifugens]|uniref:Uncharacterized protein n=1 Tax=Flavobacterium noncentrifugens TaxID=1128970 RepID=A0A1G8SHJ6_9FLAO|nr:hypothetical protein [Flavobacterium noncentrifugens]GEP49835.1 hypothetical protein FNO01nite_05070 [Flavobacterium noncentrifugens]SDJ28722.1 hypothetical protein SAMN04487935_0561 [Flavobacterium noncentrifugens]
MEIILNELSLSNVESADIAKSLYNDLFQICNSFRKKFKTQIGIKFSESPRNYTLHDDLPFEKWLTNLKKDDRATMLSMLTREKILHEYPYYKVVVGLNAIESKSIGYAFENGELLFSFQSREMWQVLELPAIQELIDEDTDDIISNDIIVTNCFDHSSSEHYNDIIADNVRKLNSALYSSINSGNELWTNRDVLFPSLIFCDDLEVYLRTLSGIEFKNLFKRLKNYQSYFSNWLHGDFDRLAVTGNARIESTSREIKFVKELTIKCPDGNSRFFTFHCDYGDRANRMHFFPDTGTKKCYIGYLGKKIV